jgi:hypothetical protein
MTGSPLSYLQQALAMGVDRDPRMAGLYNYTSDLLGPPGCHLSLLKHYSSVGLPSRYGSWGLIESITSDPATQPKLQGARRDYRVRCRARRVRLVLCLPHWILRVPRAKSMHGWTSSPARTSVVPMVNACCAKRWDSSATLVAPAIRDTPATLAFTCPQYLQANA